MDKEKPVYKIIREICSELNIDIEDYSYDYIYRFKKDGKVRNVIHYRFDLNSDVSMDIVNDKYATFEILYKNNIPIIEHNMIFNPKTRSEYVSENDMKFAEELFEKYNKKIVIKANNSSQGKEVFFIDKKNEVEKQIKDIFSRNNDSVSICPFEDLKCEYRVVVLDEECLFCYKKERVSIIGDGRSRIKDLVENLEMFSNFNNIDWDYIPKKQEKYELNWKFNLSEGALPSPVDNKDKEIILKNIAKDVCKILNIRFATVDIVENTDGEIKVMEVNGTVCMNKFVERFPNGRKIAKDIYKKAIIKMFE